MKHSYPTSEALEFLLKLIHNKEMALPDFQRDFVWDPYATNELIQSVVRNYPAGSLLRIKNALQLLFQPRAVEGAPEIEQDGHPSYLILDGQQRLTSLYQALFGVGDHKYYIDLAGLDQNKDLEDCVFYFRAKDGDAKYGAIEQQASSLVFPLGKLFDDNGFSGWLNKVLKVRAKNMEEMLDLQSRLSRVYENWIKTIEDYEFPMVTLNEETAGDAVCTIFETLNRTGVKLSVFDLLTARFWAKDLRLRQLWEEAKTELSIIDDYEIDPYYVMQIIGLIEPGSDKEGKTKAPSIKRSEILDMGVEQAQRGWEKAVDALSQVLGILRDDCGVLIPSLIPYNTMLIPMAAVWSSQLESKGVSVGSNRLKLVRWFWCSTFGAQYEKAPNSQAAKDYNELKSWMVGGEVPASVAGFDLSSLQLRNVGPRQRAIYRGVMAIILQNGAMDFLKRGKIASQLFSDKKNPVDDHHVFPQAYLAEQNIHKDLRDCILNRTFIDRLSNRSLKMRPPSNYFREIRDKHGIAKTDELLRSHLLPDGDDSPLLKDDFNGFLEKRENALMEIIRQKTG